jgi:hypothetical protein
VDRVRPPRAIDPLFVSVTVSTALIVPTPVTAKISDAGCT